MKVTFRVFTAWLCALWSVGSGYHLHHREPGHRHHRGEGFSQTTICRFESSQLSLKNMRKLKPLLQRWLTEIETNKELQEMISQGPPVQQMQKRKQRTIIATARERLENYFMLCQKPGPQEIAQIAQEVNLDKAVTVYGFEIGARKESVRSSPTCRRTAERPMRWSRPFIRTYLPSPSAA